MSDLSLQSNPAAESHRRIDFESVQVNPGIVNGTYFLTVSGTAPCTNMKVTLSPLIYIRCPGYWGIEVVGHLPEGVCKRGEMRFKVEIPLAGITGSSGIEVIGATKTERRDVEGGCESGGDFV